MNPGGSSGFRSMFNKTGFVNEAEKMKELVFQATADTLKEARKQAEKQCAENNWPENSYKLSEKIISVAGPQTYIRQGSTLESTIKNGRGGVPFGAKIIKEKIIQKPSKRTVTVKAFERIEATGKVSEQRGDYQDMKKLKVIRPGFKGIFGIGKRPDQYEAEIVHRAVVEFTYTQKAEVKWTINPKYRCQRCGHVQSQDAYNKRLLTEKHEAAQSYLSHMGFGGKASVMARREKERCVKCDSLSLKNLMKLKRDST